MRVCAATLAFLDFKPIPGLQASGFQGRISHSDRWQAQTGWNRHAHPAPRQTLIPARQTGIAAAAQDTAQPPQFARAGIPQACSAAASVDAARLQAQAAPISPADKIKRRMVPPHMA
jgi:hypothetical protein